MENHLSGFRNARHFAIAFVGEIEKLIDNFRAAFLAVEIGRLEYRAVPFDKTVSPCDFAPAREDVIPRGAVVGQKIAKSWKRLHDFKDRSWGRARNQIGVE